MAKIVVVESFLTNSFFLIFFTLTLEKARNGSRNGIFYSFR